MGFSDGIKTTWLASIVDTGKIVIGQICLPVCQINRKRGGASSMEKENEYEIRDMPKSEQQSSGLVMREGKTTFIIGLHFSKDSTDTLEDKVKKLIKRDVENDNF